MRSRLAAGSSFSLALLDRGEGLDLHQEIAAGQLRHGDRRALRRRRAEIALAQIGVFVEFGGLCDIADVNTMSLAVAPPAPRHASTFFPTCSICARISPLPTTLPAASRATCPATTTQCPPSRSATLVVGGEAAQGGPTMTGSDNSVTACQLASARLMYSSAFSRHTCSQYWLCVKYSLASTMGQASGS